MKRRLVLFAMAAAWTLVLVARAMQSPAEQNARVEEQLLNLERQWLAAEGKGDMAALNRLFADDFIGTAFGGNVVYKDDVIPREGTGGNRIWAKSSLKDATVRVFGDTAVVMGRVVVEDPEQPGEFRFTMVYMKRATGWQVVAAHLSRS